MPKLFIETFEKIIIEYFEKVSSINLSSEIYTKSYSSNIVFIGLNTIIHIFRITLCKYKNTDISHHYCKQGFVYYLEYIQQITSANFQNNLNINDAVMFVYAKTLLPITELTELISPTIPMTDTIQLLSNELGNIVNGLLLWKNELSIEVRCKIIKEHLSKYLFLFSESNLEKYVKYMSKLSNPTHLDYFYKSVKKMAKSTTSLTEYEINNKLIIDYNID